MASVRFICGTQTRAQGRSSRRSPTFLQTDDCILYSSCFDANGGLFETLLDEADAIISDELNHASIIDGVRLSKAKRFRYKNNDLADLEAKLQEADAAGARFKLIATDGVFSMDGIIADLAGICDLADRYGALVMVDDSHAVGFIGEHGRGTPEHCGVLVARRHHHRHARQGAGRRIGRLCRRAQGDCRVAAATLASLSVFEHACAEHRGRVAESARIARERGRRGAARARPCKRRALSAAR